MTTIKEINTETGEEIEREMTKAELDLMKKDAAETLTVRQDRIAKAEAKTVLLEKLGITEDEARLLLG
jgi:hypothetical protein